MLQGMLSIFIGRKGRITSHYITVAYGKAKIKSGNNSLYNTLSDLIDGIFKLRTMEENIHIRDTKQNFKLVYVIYFLFFL